MPQLVVQIAPDGARSAAVARTVAAAGAVLTPMHPGTADPALAGYFTADLPGGADAAELAAALLRLPTVTAAYVKPDDALPGG